MNRAVAPLSGDAMGQKERRLFKPEVETIVSTVIADWDLPASVCLHSGSMRHMCTIIPVENEPFWILSCWGNGPGITCFLRDYHGERFYDVLIVEVHPRYVVGLPLKPKREDFEPED